MMKVTLIIMKLSITIVKITMPMITTMVAMITTIAIFADDMMRGEAKKAQKQWY